MQQDQSIACVGVDVQYKFSTVVLVDAQGRVVRRERLEHRARERLRQQVRAWPKALTAVMESWFGWGWLSDLLVEEGSGAVGRLLQLTVTGSVSPTGAEVVSRGRKPPEPGQL